jgi:hypothetical protein
MGKLRKLLVAVVLAVAACGFLAAGERSFLAFSGNDVAVTNSQANSSWYPTAVLFTFTASPTGGVSVARRASSGVYFELSPSVTGVTNASWFADGRVYFKQGDVLWLRVGGGTGFAEVMRGSGE